MTWQTNLRQNGRPTPLAWASLASRKEPLTDERLSTTAALRHLDLSRLCARTSPVLDRAQSSDYHDYSSWVRILDMASKRAINLAEKFACVYGGCGLAPFRPGRARSDESVTRSAVPTGAPSESWRLVKQGSALSPVGPGQKPESHPRTTKRNKTQARGRAFPQHHL